MDYLALLTSSVRALLRNKMRSMLTVGDALAIRNQIPLIKSS